jgi:hypothetical protein
MAGFCSSVECVSTSACAVLLGYYISASLDDGTVPQWTAGSADACSAAAVRKALL